MEGDEELSVGSEQSEEVDDSPANDGFANALLGILHQETKKKVPVLAGRKTKLMKMIAAEKASAKSLHVKAESKRRRMKMLMGEGTGDDDSSTNSFNLDFERQLRKLATKGVVALFNAVAKAKREKMLELRKNKATTKQPSPDDDDHSLGSLRNMPSVHKRTVSEVETKGEGISASKKAKPQWNVLEDSAPSKPAAITAGWDQEEDDD